MEQIDFENPEYLKNGNNRQRQVFDVLTRHKVMDLLHEFSPILVGTFPIGIDIETSDLDIICCWQDKEVFRIAVQECFGKERHFVIHEAVIAESTTIIANFELDDFEVEIFGQAIPCKEQNGYRHMLIEHEILIKRGETFRKHIVELKKQGLKTEPAFAQLLGLVEDPYTALLHYNPKDSLFK